MATITYTPGACEALLLGQQDVFGRNTPSDLVSPVGLVQALRDPSNTRGIQLEPVQSMSGHTKQVRYFWRPPVAVGEVTDQFACDEGTTQPYLEGTVDMGLHSHLGLRVAESQIRALCEAYSQNQTLRTAQGSGAIQVMRETYEIIASGFDAMRQDMNQKLNVAMAAKLGNFLSPDGGTTPVTSKTYTLRNANGQYAGSAVLDGFAKMRQDLRKTTLNGKPIIVGNGLFELANEALNYGCCNAGGTDFGRMANSNAGYQYYIDDYTGTALGNANGLIAFMPGMAHLLTYNKNVGTFGQNIGNRIRGVIQDPAVPGLKYDISIVPNECGEYYDVYLDADYDLFVAPTTLFKATDYRTGINGTFKIIAAEQTLS